VRLSQEEPPNLSGSTVQRALTHYVDRGKTIVEPPEQIDWELLLSAADVVVHDSLPRDKAWPIDFREVAERHPQLIVISITPFGESGPRAGWLGDDLIAVASGGLAHATPGLPDYASDLEQEPPLRADALVGELTSGVHGAATAMLALLSRDRGGKGEYVEISMQEIMAALIPWDIVLWTYGKTIVGRRQARAHLGPNAFLPAGDCWVVLVAFAERHWQSLLEMMGNPDWAESELFATAESRGENWEALESLLGEWLQTQTRWDFLREAQSRGIPSVPALELPDALCNEHMEARSFLTEERIGQDKMLLPGDVFVMDGVRRRAGGPPVRSSWDRLIEEWASARADVRSAGGSPSAAPGLPLEGVRVVDFSQFVAMPLAAQWLAMMGAEVILVESQSNLHSRPHAPFAGEPDIDTGGIFNSFNNCKRSVNINLRKPEGVELAKRLIAQADMVVENFSPGTMERLGLGYDELRKVKPDLVMISLSAFRAEGPWKHFASFHSGVVALSGFAAVTGYEEGAPRILGAVAPDTVAGSYCFLAALQALRRRRRSGEGQHIEIAMSETLQSVAPEAIAEFGLTGKPVPRLGNRHRQKAPHGVYRCQGDDAWLAVSVSSDEQWQALRSVIDAKGLDDARYETAEGRKRHEAALDAAIAEWAKDRAPQEAAALLQEAGVPAAAAYNARDLVEDRHMLERETVVTVDHPKAGSHPMVGAPWHLMRAPRPHYRSAPLFGEANAYVLGQVLGLSEEQIQELAAAEAVK
jgi:crotonobetainyl-CoA:carnitine CoA-transferase CaiB-like acyl-CoA transferase